MFAIYDLICHPSQICCQLVLRGSAPAPPELQEVCWVAGFISDAGTLHSVCSEGHSNMSDLTLEMGCNLSSPRALCLILLIREREKRARPLCSFSVHNHHSLLHSLYQLLD